MILMNSSEIKNKINDLQQITDDVLNHLDKNNSRMNREELTMLMNSLEQNLGLFYNLIDDYESREINEPILAKNGTKVIHVGQAKTRMLEKKLDEITKIINNEAY